jgi:hypothetical protein
MNVIGLTDGLRDDAEQQCAEGFRAWIVEAEQGTWGGWEELKKHYPKVCQMSDDEAHFPLTTDGTGVRAMVFFSSNLILLGRIAPAPVSERISLRRPISQPPTTRKTRSNTSHHHP